MLDTSDNRFLRQLGIVTPRDLDRLGSVTIIGAGGIGSPTALALAKMGVEQIHVFDHDMVENHNLPNQMFRLADLGSPKVTALAAVLDELTGVQPLTVPNDFTGQELLSGVVVAAVDSMATRKMIWEAVKKSPGVFAFLDGRLGAETLRVYTVEPAREGHIDFYEANLYPDEEVHQAPCTERATIYTGFVIAGFIAGQIKKLARHEPYHREIMFDLVTMSIITQ